jgi:hypothetical protein
VELQCHRDGHKEWPVVLIHSLSRVFTPFFLFYSVQTLESAVVYLKKPVRASVLKALFSQASMDCQIFTPSTPQHHFYEARCSDAWAIDRTGGIQSSCAHSSVPEFLPPLSSAASPAATISLPESKKELPVPPLVGHLLSLINQCLECANIHDATPTSRSCHRNSALL